MLPGFTQKLEQVKQARKKAWKPVRALEKEIAQFKSQFDELDGFLQDLFPEEGNKKNAYNAKISEKRNILKKHHPIWGTDCIDTAIHVWSEDKVIGDNLLKHLHEICTGHKNSEMQYHAALLLFMLCDKHLNKTVTAENYQAYKQLFDDAGELLVKTDDADLIYAQWGKTLYETCVLVLANEDTKETCLEICLEVYDKIAKVKTNIEGIEKYTDFVPGNEANEVGLLIKCRKEKISNVKEIQKLLDDQTDAHRLIIRNYRSLILIKAFRTLSICCFDSKDKQQEIRDCANTFSADLDEIFHEREQKILSFYKKRNENCTQSFIQEKRYQGAIPEEYQCIHIAKYEMDLNRFLSKKAEQYAPKEVDTEWLYERTKEFVNQNKAKFEEWLEKHIKVTCIPDYKKKIEKRIYVAVKTKPKYATGYRDLADYQFDLYLRCIDNAHCAQVEQDAWKNRWIGSIPDEAIEQYFKQEEKLFNAELKKENRENGFKNFKANLSLGKVVKWIIIANIVLSVIGTIPTLIHISQQENATVSDEELWKKKEKAIGKIEAELSPTATPASNFTYEAVDYVGSSDVIEIVSYNGTDEVVEIPAVIDGMNVAYIRDGAFRDNMFLKRVVMPDTIHGIRDGAFENCTNLQEVVFSKNLTFILNNAFKNCTSLKTVQFGSDVSSLDSIASSVFADCTALETVTIQSDVYSIVTLGDYAFAGCTSLKEINVNGENLQGVELRGHAFENCTSLETLLFADKVTTLGEGVFKSCTSLNNISLPNITNIPKETFYGCTALSTFHIANTVTGIEDMAFRECTNLTTVTFDETPLEEEGTGRYIRDHAFAYSGLTEIELPGYYEAVDNWAFRDTPLTTFVWHAGKGINQSLSTNAFGECDSLREVYLPKTIKEMRDAQDVFYSSTIYAAEGGTAYNYAMEHNYPWSTWTE